MVGRRRISKSWLLMLTRPPPVPRKYLDKVRTTAGPFTDPESGFDGDNVVSNMEKIKVL